MPFGDAVTPSAKRREYSTAELAGVCMICAGLLFGSLGECLSMWLANRGVQKISDSADVLDSEVTSRRDFSAEMRKASEHIETQKAWIRTAILTHRLALVGRVGFWVCLAGMAIFMLVWRSAEHE
jgi:hypothetical protein